jgi:hypothetical protein
MKQLLIPAEAILWENHTKEMNRKNVGKKASLLTGITGERILDHIR